MVILPLEDNINSKNELSVHCICYSLFILYFDYFKKFAYSFENLLRLFHSIVTETIADPFYCTHSFVTRYVRLIQVHVRTAPILTYDRTPAAPTATGPHLPGYIQQDRNIGPVLYGTTPCHTLPVSQDTSYIM